ncbi:MULTISPECIES: NAD(P)/FAD-dependent oxidoreductase [unclassified Mucilaginibacter]|uniref:NAD(P)/FAD-dependent oxidoreductase n=1 Tax=unclassified Mucilaginibacter TaxID=2617802 RepID=UPI002AC9DCBC|nr:MULTISPECIES: NAD(P)/FAD-dependent oxidoreductase [unclassified Mucilaginibacter]MEB0260105.1 NAD(P)/FAD-dependent oxidoreductase [Mucilaginibacter sp. 10I4]MEB0279173.1 NAD(P)/FAD-dependent oxidoreductase [Mucilaginibacter sp. 10B2]MEB0301570.1 NAD(P)/FAD-dependent oxidoreductase [Mucilaginibacter sp. 5C4]WPX22352.1 NAD(P)/FAD-dependent oxidoreductase [Mucilaginibacter sp. 5C4]
MKNDAEVIIIGAGLAGLTAAKVLKEAGKSVLILEGSDAVGGRVRTDEVNGFLLDRGFQVFLTAYPEAKRFLDYDALKLCKFDPGALILNRKGITNMGDPIRQPSSLISTLLSPAATFVDKMRMLKLKLVLGRKSIEEIFAAPEITTTEYLKRKGFSGRIMNQFFRPFMTGIFLEDQLTTSSRMFEFVFKMFSEGDAAIPEGGMGMIPKQLAEGLLPEEIIFKQRVWIIESNSVTTTNGEIYKGNFVLNATDELNSPAPIATMPVAYHSVSNMYFTSVKKPFKMPLIALNTLPSKLVNNIAIMDSISPAYSKSGDALISLSLIGNHIKANQKELQENVINELKFWYPDAINWKHLKTYHIDYALPNDEHVRNLPDYKDIRLNAQCLVCGDYLMNGSINAAMKSGRLAAEAIIQAIPINE